jgi:hypothetical protein
VNTSGSVTLRYKGMLHHIGVGCPYAGWRFILLVAGPKGLHRRDRKPSELLPNQFSSPGRGGLQWQFVVQYRGSGSGSVPHTGCEQSVNNSEVALADNPSTTRTNTSTTSDPNTSKDARNVAIAAIAVLLGLTLAAGIYAQNASGWISGTLAGYGAFATGVFVGFLFGIPRTSTPNANTNSDGSPAFLTNSNLVEISDWLTKILVGLGLVELGRATHGFTGLIVSVRTGLGGGSGSSLMASGLLVVGAISGFMCSYLITIIMAPGLFRRAALGGIQQLVQEAKVAASQAQLAAETATTTSADTSASQLVHRQLDPLTPPVDEKELVAALQAASPDERERMGPLAAEQRRFSRAVPDRQDAHDQTVEVFRALTVVDPNNWVNHAQLGFALGESKTPNYGESIKELDTAISLRGPARRATDFFAELARARSAIKLYENNGTEEQRQQISADLKSATDGNPKIAQIVQNDPELESWLNPPAA